MRLYFDFFIYHLFIECIIFINFHPIISQLFEPSVEMMVDDFDDERTMEEEEALAAAESEDPDVELSSLRDEQDMPIEQLMALYNCPAPATPKVVAADAAVASTDAADATGSTSRWRAGKRQRSSAMRAAAVIESEVAAAVAAAAASSTPGMTGSYAELSI